MYINKYNNNNKVLLKVNNHNIFIPKKKININNKIKSKVLIKIKKVFFNSMKKNLNTSYNKYYKYFSFSKNLKSILLKNKFMLYNYKHLLINIKKNNYKKKYFSNFNYFNKNIDINKNFINYIKSTKTKGSFLIKILTSLSDNFFFGSNYSIITNKRSICKKKGNKYTENLLERSYKIEQLNINDKKAFNRIIGKKKINYLLNLKQRFNYKKYRKNRYKDLLKDAN
jgi:hypothetical protein